MQIATVSRIDDPSLCRALTWSSLSSRLYEGLQAHHISHHIHSLERTAWIEDAYVKVQWAWIIVPWVSSAFVWSLACYDAVQSP